MAHKLHLDTDELKRLYVDELKSLEEIAKMKNTSRRSIANWLIRAGVPRRGYDDRYNAALNKSIVEYLTGWKNQTPYIVGYIYADGSIDDLNERSKGVSLSCVSEDREIIDGIAEELGLADKVRVQQKAACVALGKYHYGPRSMCRLRFHSNEVVGLLAQYGILPRKTYLNYGLPAVPPDLMPHFLRGVFDGDGWTSYRLRGKQEVTSFGFLGPQAFVTEIRDFLTDRVGMNSLKILKRPGHFAVAWTRPIDAAKLYRFMYPEGKYVQLRRKRDALWRIAEAEKGKVPHRGKFVKGHPHHPRRHKDVQTL